MKILSLRQERFLWILVICSIVLIFLFSSKAFDNQNPSIAYLQLIQEAILRIQENYVDEDKVLYKDLAYGAIQGMLKTLNDDHTLFLSAKDFSRLRESLNNVFGGLGIYIVIRDELPTVVSPIEDTPAFYSGIQSGDRIVDIEGVLTKGMDVDEVIKKLKGSPGSKVSIKILREGALNLIPLTITRAIIKVPTVRYTFIKKGIAYIRILSFGEKTPADLKKAISNLKKKGIQKLVLDLRNNPGGLLKVAVAVVDMFLDHGKIVFTQGRQANENESFYSNPDKTLIPESIPLVVLVNQGSASASEIVAGAIQDTQRGFIIGNKTFGKGSVQSIIPLQKSNEPIAIRLTIQKYFTPSGRSIHGKGIEPDTFVYLPKKDFDQLYMEKKLYDGQYLKNFIDNNSQYSKKQLNDFVNKLKAKNIILNERTIEKYLRSKKYDKKNAPIFNLQYDLTLKKAVEILESTSFLKRPVRSF